MKKLLLTILLPALLSVTGCDGLRRLAGRPTSEEIAVKKARIEVEEAAHQARLAALRALQKAEADSLVLLDSIKASGTMLTRAGAVRGLSTAGLKFRLYVVVGTFGSKENALALASKAEKAGYSAVLIPFNNGFSAVGLEGSDSMERSWRALQKIRGESFCPEDAWILLNE